MSLSAVVEVGPTSADWRDMGDCWWERIATPEGLGFLVKSGAYVQSCFSRAQSEQTGRSPGQRDFFRLAKGQHACDD